MKRIPRAIEERLGELQARFEVDFGRKIRTYSKGMRQAIGIIQAFMHRPDLAILDEPTSGLDPVMQERFHDLLLEERERGAAVFLSSHILMEVARTCDRVAMLKNGRLLGVDTIEAYRARVGKRITIETARPAGALREWLETAGGVTGINAGPNRIEFYFTGDMQSLLRWIRTVDIVDFTCERPDVETVFRSLYRDERRHE
jgi:ABC-2 type transport system ATP-binding protein